MTRVLITNFHISDLLGETPEQMAQNLVDRGLYEKVEILDEARYPEGHPKAGQIMVDMKSMVGTRKEGR